MTPADLDILEALGSALRAVAGVRSVRLARPGEAVEVPLSRLPAVVLEPDAAEPLTWPGVPVGRYHLLHWRASVLDRAVPHTRAFGALVALAEACRDAVAADPLLDGKAADGPPSLRSPELQPAVGATRTGALAVDKAVAARPTAVRFAGACGTWTASQADQASLDGEHLFGSGPHVVEVGSPAHRVEDVAFNGLSGGLAVDLGEGPRTLRQTGVLSAATDWNLALLLAAIEAFIDGRTYTLTAPNGVDYPNCRVAALERLGPPQVGTAWHQPYRVTYQQLAR
ncbi:MAG: hypothetical protein ISS74_07645 [Planctomycetes bacterium]|nr:hypothetical protein [Planctomycetota bacterium]